MWLTKWEMCRRYVGLQLGSTEWERIWRYVRVTVIVYRMEDKLDICRSYMWEMFGRYVGLTAGVYRMGEDLEICGSYSYSLQNGR